MTGASGARSATGAVCAAMALALAAMGCSKSTVLSTRYTLASDPVLGDSAPITVDARDATKPTMLADLGSLLRLDHDGLTMPVVSPSGRFAAVQTTNDAPWNVRLGDALPPSGLRSRIEAVSLEAASLGLPLATVTGPWLLGRAATEDWFLVERPRADGGRDIVRVDWAGGATHDVVADGWTNAFATASPVGDLAWCRRPAEGGDWQLVLERGGTRRVLAGDGRDQWFYPVFAGDGTGVFSLRLTGSALAMVWLPFETDGFPSADTLRTPTYAVPLAMGATIATAAQVMAPIAGLAESTPGSEFVVLYAPGLQRAAAWTPGGLLEPFADRAIAATRLDAEAALITTPEMLARVRLNDPDGRVEMIAEGPWIARPTTVSPSVVVIVRMRNGRVELATLDARP